MRQIVDAFGERCADDPAVSEWEQELARIDVEALPREARQMIASIVESYRREDAELAELQHPQQAAAA